MAWEMRGKRAYYYRTFREKKGGWRRSYFGTGPIGRLAAAADALRRAEREDYAAAQRTARSRLKEAIAQTIELHCGCELLASAVLLLAGFHRPARHAWRIWRRGRKALRPER
jgi:hypothetical protein